jgi:hypothetical protein
MVATSFKYPYERCEELWNSELKIFKDIHALAKLKKIDVDKETGADFHKFHLGQF